jgi:hypothetical protein
MAIAITPTAALIFLLAAQNVLVNEDGGVTLIDSIKVRLTVNIALEIRAAVGSRARTCASYACLSAWQAQLQW